jgi:hypothetical protein
MSRWQDAQLAAIEFNEGANRFCLDRIPEDDENYSPDHHFRFVWRGNKIGPNNLVPDPAHFSWDLLGQVIRHALDNGHLPIEEFEVFMRALLGLR